ncbi:unnamed protein product [Cladocopium goreaui]|uniref:S-adenosylmethionine synthase n=1 Tax=Cladocopium goreaui TaxID=2562237 RepID=A0A9P1CIE7_9DINO|nr:unnamed protein product [Cladocopium goreaui]
MAFLLGNLPSSTVELPSLPHILPKVSLVESDARLDASNNDDMRFIRVRPVRAHSCPTEDELVDAEWHSLVDMEMSRSPRSAHLQMREDRRQEQLQRAREKDRLKEMQAKLERYQRNEPEYETTSMGTGARQPRQTVPFSQKRQQEILEEFQRQNDLQMEKATGKRMRRVVWQEEQAEKIRLQQQRQKLKEERRQQRRESRVAPEAAAPMSSGQVHGSLLGSLARRIWRLLSRENREMRREAEMVDMDVDIAKPLAGETMEQRELLVRQVEDSMAKSRQQPLAMRRKIFRELQRKLHPDKNEGCDAFKLAFQDLMDRQRVLERIPKRLNAWAGANASPKALSGERWLRTAATCSCTGLKGIQPAGPGARRHLMLVSDVSSDGRYTFERCCPDEVQGSARQEPLAAADAATMAPQRGWPLLRGMWLLCSGERLQGSKRYVRQASYDGERMWHPSSSLEATFDFAGSQGKSVVSMVQSLPACGGPELFEEAASILEEIELHHVSILRDLHEAMLKLSLRPAKGEAHVQYLPFFPYLLMALHRRTLKLDYLHCISRTAAVLVRRMAKVPGTVGGCRSHAAGPPTASESKCSYTRPTAELLGLTLATALLPPPRKGRSCSALVEAVPRPNDGALKRIGRFGLWTKLDLEILQVWPSAVANLILPAIIGAVDMLWIGQLGDPHAMAGVGATNQVYNTIYFLVGFLPNLVTPSVAEEIRKGRPKKAAQWTTEALSFASLMGLLGSVALVFFPHTVLKLVADSPQAAWDCIPRARLEVSNYCVYRIRRERQSSLVKNYRYLVAELYIMCISLCRFRYIYFFLF